MEHTTITMDKKVHRRLKAFCAINNIKVSQFVTEAVEDKLAYFTFHESFDPTEWGTETESAAQGVRELVEKLKKGELDEDA